MTPGYMTLTLGPRKNPQRKVSFLLEKTVDATPTIICLPLVSMGRRNDAIPPSTLTVPYVEMARYADSRNITCLKSNSQMHVMHLSYLLEIYSRGCSFNI